MTGGGGRDGGWSGQLFGRPFPGHLRVRPNSSAPRSLQSRALLRPSTSASQWPASLVGGLEAVLDGHEVVEGMRIGGGREEGSRPKEARRKGPSVLNGESVRAQIAR